MVQRFAPNVYECILKMAHMAHKRQLEYVVDAAASFVRHHRRNQQVFCQEAVMWRYLTHPNIVPLLGVSIVPFQLISKWMPGGDLPGYIQKNPSADRLELVGCIYPMLTSVTSYPASRRASAISTPAMWSMVTSRVYAAVLTQFHHRIDACPAEHPHRRLR